MLLILGSRVTFLLLMLLILAQGLGLSFLSRAQLQDGRWTDESRVSNFELAWMGLLEEGGRLHDDAWLYADRDHNRNVVLFIFGFFTLSLVLPLKLRLSHELNLGRARKMVGAG